MAWRCTKPTVGLVRMVNLLQYLLLLCGCHICLSVNDDSVPNEVGPPELNENSGTLYATCRMRPNYKLATGMPKIYGHVMFKQEHADDKIKVAINLHGFPTSDGQFRAIHIHQYGDLTEGCYSTAGHYDPVSVDHPRHPGDFGNFPPSNGKIVQTLDSDATLFGGLSVLGRSVVVHAKEDDLGRGGDAGSLLHGNAGERLACCVIGMARPKVWDRFQQKRRRV
ncbi:extracellular superoxide dismutase [Cu-Zn] isoform X1 [Alosa pseudoharengus]|uniref:extracellular superoxide dismutase [Cu-Zn] isoform X1 n=2 Tax=Alosa pseudoharengus TaxID=34774 RepID=UPI003F898822